MQYQSVTAGTFLERPNRFIAMVDLDGRTERVHVKNTGRCRELLVPGYKVYLAHGTNPNRKTRYDLIAVEKERPGKTPLLINLDSQIPNDAAEEWLRKGTLFSENAIIEREVTYGNSRFDFRITDGEMQSFLEVKGVTLEQDGVVSFFFSACGHKKSCMRFGIQRTALGKSIVLACHWFEPAFSFIKHPLFPRRNVISSKGRYSGSWIQINFPLPSRYGQWDFESSFPIYSSGTARDFHPSSLFRSDD